MLRCPDCGRVIAAIFPVHGCEPTTSWREENPGVSWIIRLKAGGYAGRNGRNQALAVSRQRDAVRYLSRQKAIESYERLGYARDGRARIVRLNPRKKAKAKRGR
jgi:hypothetical protein